MKRSLPCLELTSMDNIDEHPLLHLVNKRMKSWDDSAVLERCSASKNYCLSTANTSPASSALESFLRIAVEDFAPLSDFNKFSDFSDKHLLNTSSYRNSKPCSLILRKLDRRSMIPSMHDVTRGMSRISASN